MKLCNFLYLLTIHVTSDLEHFFFMIEFMESEWNLLLQTVQA